MQLTPETRAALAESTAFERFALEAATPAHDSGMTAATVDLRRNPGVVQVQVGVRVGVSVVESAGRATSTPASTLRPLLFGAAFKVLDLMLEAALEAANLTPRRPARWTIAEKIKHAQRGAGQLPPITDVAPEVWTRLCGLYVAFEQVRHSLVHRTAHVDGTDGSLSGVDDQQGPLRPVSTGEQEQFCRLAVEVREAVLAGVLAPRSQRRISWRLNELAAQHGDALLVDAAAPHPVVRVIGDLTARPNGLWCIDVAGPLAQARGICAAASEFDGVFYAHRSGTTRTFRCRLEEAPDEAEVDLAAPPEWLREITT